ncbi:hypothetical protein ACOSP7_019434 [Xanthoceras sorbifolium]
MANQNTFHPLYSSSNGDEEGSDEESSEEDLVPQPHRGARREILEFQGNLSPEEFLIWLRVVEEILEFKNVLPNASLALVATRLRGRTAVWWQQLKLTLTRMGKPKIMDWEKMTRKMHTEFLPHNFQRLMYQKLQNLRQETHDQLVSRYCGGLHLQIVEVVNLFDPIIVSQAHQRSLQVDKTVTRWGGGGLLSSNSCGAAARSSTSSGHTTSRAAAGSSGIFPRPVANPNQQPRTSNGLRCFSYGEKVMFAETDEGEDRDADMGAEPQFDEEEEV